VRSETVVQLSLNTIEAELREHWQRMELATNPATDTTPFDVMDAIGEEFNYQDVSYGGYDSVFVSPVAFNNVIQEVEASYDAGDKDAILYLSMLATRVNDACQQSDRRLRCCIILHDRT
jgi:hypothetical protein